MSRFCTNTRAPFPPNGTRRLMGHVVETNHEAERDSATTQNIAVVLSLSLIDAPLLSKKYLVFIENKVQYGGFDYGIKKNRFF